MADHERSANIDHLRGSRTLFENVHQHRRGQAALAPSERFCQRRGVEPDKKVCRKLRERGHAGIAYVESLLRDRVEDRLASSGAFAITRNEDRAIAALDHSARATHGSVEEPEPLGRYGLGKTTRQLREIVLIWIKVARGGAASIKPPVPRMVVSTLSSEGRIVKTASASPATSAMLRATINP